MPIEQFEKTHYTGEEFSVDIGGLNKGKGCPAAILFRSEPVL
jgi:hypothetical protein